MRTITRSIWALLALAALLPSAAAQTDHYPSRPITIIVPFPPGGSSDVVTRLVAAKFARYLNEFPKDQLAAEEKLTTKAMQSLVDGELNYRLVRRRRSEA